MVRISGRLFSSYACDASDPKSNLYTYFKFQPEAETLGFLSAYLVSNLPKLELEKLIWA